MQKINLKKTTKEQMLNMLETAWQANTGANEEIATLSKRIEEQNDALAKCVAEKNELRDQARNATGNAEYWYQQFCNAEQRADYAERHLWRNLWTQIKYDLFA